MKLLNRKPMLLLLALLLVFGLVTMSALAQIEEEDCTVTHGDYLGENYIDYMNPNEAYVLGRSLFMYDSPDLASAPIDILTSGAYVEILGEQSGAYKIRTAEGSNHKETYYIEGWVDSRFVVNCLGFYIAMHPTAVYISPHTDAKLLMIMNTYDDLHVVEEYDDFYAVLVRGGIGYVEKEQQQEEGT